MRINLRSKWWTFGTILFGLLFIAWSIFLTVEVSEQQGNIRANVNTIGKLNNVENYIEEIRDSFLDSALNKTDTSFFHLTDELGKNALLKENISTSVSNFSELKNIKRDAYQAQSRVEFFRNGKMFSDKADQAIEQVEMAIGKVRMEQAKISVDLSSKWQQLHFLVVIACIAVILIFFLLRLVQKNMSELLKSRKESNNLNIFLNTILENIPDMVFIKDAKELRFVRLNKAAEEILGISRDEMIGKNDYDFFSKEQASFFISKDKEVLAGNEIVDIPEELIDTKSGEKRWLHTKKLPLNVGKDESAFLLGISRDITEQKMHIDEIKMFNEELERQVNIRTAELIRTNGKLLVEIEERFRAEEEIRLSEKKYEMLINTIEEGIIYTDTNGTILFVNQKFTEITSFSPEELIGTSGEMMLADEVGEMKIKESLQNRLNDMKESYELDIKKKSGDQIRLHVTGVPIKDRSGNVIGSLGSHRDITHIRNTEKKLLEKIDALNMFLYRSSHDLKGPLASMQGLLLLAQKDITDAVALNYIRMLVQSADKLDKTLLGLIEVLNVTQGDKKVEKVDLKELVGEIVDGFDHLPQRKTMRIDQEIHADIKIKIDKTVLRSALQNLIHNAIVYRKRDFPNSFVRISSMVGNNRLQIKIQDNGVGIPKALEQKVFDIFFRANLDSPGSGLGLYITKNAIEKINATISMSSEVGVGTIFIIDIPVSLNE